MSENTSIEWCDYSASPWEGCTMVSPGCAHCYAATRDMRHLHEKVDHWGKGAPRRIVLGYENKIRAWNRKAGIHLSAWKRMLESGATEEKLVADGFLKPRRPTVFASVMDPFDAEVPIEQFANFARIIHENQNLIFLLLTKRPELFQARIKDVLSSFLDRRCYDSGSHGWLSDWRHGARTPFNVWVGTSVENQEWADKRIPELLQIPAVGRFLSVEPMLGPVQLGLDRIDAECGFFHSKSCVDFCDFACAGHTISGGIDWVIFGGESGRGARPCSVDWIRAGVRQCREAGVSPFVKQLGADPFFVAGCEMNYRITHPKGGDPSEWPADLRVREFPEGLR